MDDEWLTPTEAAARLGTTVGNTRVIAHRRRWRVLREGNHVRYHADDIEQEKQQREALRQLTRYWTDRRVR